MSLSVRWCSRQTPELANANTNRARQRERGVLLLSRADRSFLAWENTCDSMEPSRQVAPGVPSVLKAGVRSKACLNHPGPKALVCVPPTWGPQNQGPLRASIDHAPLSRPAIWGGREDSLSFLLDPCHTSQFSAPKVLGNKP